MKDGFISVTPLQPDLTAYDALDGAGGASGHRQERIVTAVLTAHGVRRTMATCATF